jgi:hypothetical protein
MKSEFLLNAARELSDNLSEDIAKCATREEHIRVTARANAAVALYNAMFSEYGDLSMELEEDL